MLDERSFLQAINADPDDDGPRLLYADFLDEKGDPASTARAEFIRVQCALEAMSLDDPVRASLRSREMSLLEANWRTWIRPACQALGEPLPVGPSRGVSAHRYSLRWLKPPHKELNLIEQAWFEGGEPPYFHSCQFRRGLLAHAALVAKSYRSYQHVARLWERQPLDGLALDNFQPAEVQAALTAIDATRLRSIELSHTSVTTVEAVFNLPAPDLNQLVLRGIHVPYNSDLSFLKKAVFHHLRTLVLVQFPIGDIGLEAIATAEFAGGLERLVIDNCRETTEFVLWLDQDPHRFPRLREIGISGFNRAALTILSRRFGDGAQATGPDLPFPWRYYQ